MRTALQAVATARSTTRWGHAKCLNFVWSMYGSIPSDLPPLANVAYALQGWMYSKHQHPGDRTPPAGAPIYFTAAGSGATAGEGHIAIATGRGDECISTDINGYGTVGLSHISTVERTWRRKYLGWTGDMLGHLIDFGTTTATVGTATIIQQQQGENMFTFSRKSSRYLYVPQGAKGYGVVLGSQDKNTGFAHVDFAWDNSWADFKKTLTNLQNVA